MKKTRIFQYIDQPVKHGVLSVLQIVGIFIGAIGGFFMCGGFGMILGGLGGAISMSYYSEKNKKGYLKKWAYFNLPSYEGQYGKLPENYKRYFL